MSQQVLVLTNQRRLQVKCDKQRPSCTQCGRLDVQCLYDPGTSSASSVSRKPPPESRYGPESGSGTGGHTQLDPALHQHSTGRSSTLAPSQDLGMDWITDRELDSTFLTASDFPMLADDDGNFLFNQDDSHASYLPLAQIAESSQPGPTNLPLPSTLMRSGHESPPTAVEFDSQNFKHGDPEPWSSSSKASQGSSQRNLSPFWAWAANGVRFT